VFSLSDLLGFDRMTSCFVQSHKKKSHGGHAVCSSTLILSTGKIVAKPRTEQYQPGVLADTAPSGVDCRCP